MKSRLYLTLGLYSLLQLPSPALATTVYFLPGDAYFRTTMTEEFLEHCEKGKPITFYYRPAEAYFCGYSGTPRLRFADQDGKLLEQLKQAYGVIRSLYPKRGIMRQEYKTVELKNGDFKMEKVGEPRFEETNELHMFFYNADFDFEKHRLLHLYNENWREEQIGNERGPQEIVQTREVLLESMVNGPHVAPLKVIQKGSAIEEAHLIPDGEWQIIIVPLEDWLQPVAQQKMTATELGIPSREEMRDHPGRFSPPVIFIIKSDGLYVRRLEDGRWTNEEKFNPEELTKKNPSFF